MNFSGKTVLVTGSSRGIGAAIIKKFASYGANVIINYINDYDSAIKLEEEIRNKYKVKSLVIKCDVSEEQDVKRMFHEIEQVFHSIDVLVNNAGIAIDTTFDDKSVENFKRILDVNLIGTFLVSKYASKYMLKEKCGKIINIASTNGIDTLYPESLDYDASKAGVISLTKNFARALAPYVNVNAIAPGWVYTDMNKEISEEEMDAYKKDILLNRIGTPEEIANVVAFLASEEAKYINSEIIRVDGGELK